MKNLEMNAGMQELSREEMVSIEGGNWLGDIFLAVGELCNAVGSFLNKLF